MDEWMDRQMDIMTEMTNKSLPEQSFGKKKRKSPWTPKTFRNKYQQFEK